MKRSSVRSLLTVGTGAFVVVAGLPVAQAQTQSAGLEEVFVTARKREEGVQAVPISITALSGEALDQRGVRDLESLNSVIPGFHFGVEGGKGNTSVILRGLSKIPLGEGVSSVVTYFANIALPPHGGNIPTYDIANIQVLKGPQGTLFGRNTLGGAVVITPVAPTYEFGGYIKGDYGTKNFRSLEGAVNVPIVEDKVAVRVAGQIRRQDGLVKNITGGPDTNNTHQNNYRISLLLNPIDNLESTTVYDHTTAIERSGGEHLYSVQPGFFPSAPAFLPGGGVDVANPQTQLFGLGQLIIPQLNASLAAQHAAGFWSGAPHLTNGGNENENLWGIANDTSYDTGVVTVRNIFGYRRVNQFENLDTANVGNITLPLGPGGSAIPFVIFDAAQELKREYLSDEFQLFGNAFDDKLDWIVGAFYNKDQNTGPSGSTFTQFSAGGEHAPAIAALVKNENKSIFGQIGLDISQWTVEGLKFNAGLRESWDSVWACGGSLNPDELLSVGECKDNAGNVGADPVTGAPIAVGITTTSGKDLSWTIGFDWQISPDTLAYITSRRGYRGVNVNTPLFQTPFTTGGTGCLTTTGACPNLTSFQKVDPEKLTDLELGVKNDWAVGDVKGRLNVATFVSKYDKAVQFLNVQALGIPNGTPDTPTNSSVGVNAANLTIWGVEADLTVIPVDSLTVTFSGAYTEEHIDKVVTPSGGLSLSASQITLPSPKFSGTLAAAWTLPVHPLEGDVIVSGDYFHTDKYSGQGGQNLPGYELANFRLDWKGIAQTKLDLEAYLNNAFDTHYYASPDVFLGNGFPVQVLIQGLPREWGVQAKYSF
ncbi:MAG: TonB-dependent receptor [Verrucomicrobiaceae bacterium]|nr:TonB-dependent receptor [Verrucomicrobiaceae bacterium]